MNILTIDQMLAADSASIKEVPVPELGGVVHVKRLTALENLAMGRQIRDIQAAAADPSPHGRTKAVVVASLVAYLCDPAGKPLATIEQAQALCEKEGAGPAVDRIFSVGHELNGENTEKVAKNSAPSPSA